MASDAVSGLWAADFISGYGTYGSGLIVFKDNQILGGDESYFYSGEYTLQGNIIRTLLLVRHYRGPLNNIFGPLSEVSLNIEGAVSDGFLMGNGHVVNQPSYKMSFKMKLLKKA